MPAAKYDQIFHDLRQKIECLEYVAQELLPSEHSLIEEYHCARNTVRRAISQLVAMGYVQSIHGKGVYVIYNPSEPSQYSLGQIESFREASQRNNQQTETKVIVFTKLSVDDRIHTRTMIPIGTEIYYVQRVRYINGTALIIDHNYFRADIVSDLTKEICEASVYDYIENTLHQVIITTKRVVTVEHITASDEKYLDLNGCNCVAVVSNSTYNIDGVMFEFTQSRHSPDFFVFYDQAHRRDTRLRIE
jgi:GntR family trehalose operon transcriptional repressor